MRKKSGFFKKGNIQEIVFVAGLAMMLIISIFFATRIMSEFNNKIQSSDMPTIAKDASQVVRDKYPSLLDYFFLLVVIILFIGSMISAWFIDTTPAFFILSIIVLIVGNVAIALMQNVTEETINSPELSAYASEYPIMTFYAQNMLKINVVLGAILLVVLYAKTRTE